MEIQDSLKLFVDLKSISTGPDYTPIWIVIISGIFSIILAYITSKLTRKRELDKLKDLSQQLEYSVKQALLSIESENYKKLYELKLSALKKIKEISFNHLERNPNNYIDYDDFLYNFPYSEIMDEIHKFIINYSYGFNEEISSLLKVIYRDSEYADNNMGEAFHDLTDYADSIHENFKKLIKLIEDDMSINYKNFESLINKPIPK